MADIPGGINSQPVNLDLPSSAQGAAGAPVGKTTIGAGLITDTRLQMMKGEKVETQSQVAHKPTLIKPRDMGVQKQVSASKTASEDLGKLGATVKTASQEIGATMVRTQLGMQTPADKQTLQRNADTLKGVSDYMESLSKGKEQIKPSEKAVILSEQGFADDQIEDLLQSQSDKGAFKTNVQARHGEHYSNRHAQLKEMGMDSQQADMALSQTDDNLAKSEDRKDALRQLFKDNPTAKKLIEMGFSERKTKELMAMLGKGKKPADSMVGDEKMTRLAKNMGFGEKDAQIMLASGHPDKIKEQRTLIAKMEVFPQTKEGMKAAAQYAQSMAEGADISPQAEGTTAKGVPEKFYLAEHLKQQADIFMVLELIHNSSVQQRRNAREFRAVEYDQAKMETLKQADLIRSAAAKTFIADMVSGGFSIAAGGMSMGMAGKSLKGMGKKGGGANDADTNTNANTRKNAPADAGSFDAIEVKANKGRIKKADNLKKDMDAAETKANNKKTDADTDTQQTAQTKKQVDIETSNDKFAKKTGQKTQQKDAQADMDARKSEAKAEAQEQNSQHKARQKKEVNIEQTEDTKVQKANKEQQQNIENQEVQNKISANNNKAMALGQIMQGAGQATSGIFKFLAAEDQALQKESEARQKTHENAAQAWSEWMQLQQEQVKNCQSKIDEISRIHFDTLKSLSRG